MALGRDPAREVRLADLRAEMIKDLHSTQPGSAEGGGPVDPQRQQEVLDAFQEWHASGDTPSMTFVERMAGRDGDSVGPTESPPDQSSGIEDALGDAAGPGGPDEDAGGLDLSQAMIDNPFAGSDGVFAPGWEAVAGTGYDLPDLSQGVDPGIGPGIGAPAGPGPEAGFHADAGMDPGAGNDPGGGLDLSSGMDPGAGFDPSGVGYDLAGGGMGDMGGYDLSGGVGDTGGLDVGVIPDPGGGFNGFDGGTDPAATGAVGGELDASGGFGGVDAGAGGMGSSIDPGAAGGFDGGFDGAGPSGGW